MELVVLGCWSPYPRSGGACSGYLIRDGGMNVMLDAGNGSLSRLMNFIDFRSLDAVIISHLHHDHYLDLFPLRHAIEGARREGGRIGPVELFLPSQPLERYNSVAAYRQAFAVTAIENLPVEAGRGKSALRRLELGGLTFDFTPAKHSLPGYSIAVTGSGRMVFSGDTARTEDLVALAEGADLFLCEASGYDSDAAYLHDMHLTARQAGEIAREAGVKKLLITHFWPEYDVAELAEEARTGFGSRVSAAREGEIYQI